MVIQSERLIFRKMEECDFAVVAEMMRDDAVRAVWEHDFSDEDVREWMARRQKGYRENGIDYLLAVEKESGEAVGQIGLLKSSIDGEEIWEIGYILLSRYHGRGYATEGAKAMAEYAFHTLNIPKIVCDIRPMNKASIAVAKRIGMVETGSFVKVYMGKEMPHLIFELKKRNQI